MSSSRLQHLKNYLDDPTIVRSFDDGDDDLTLVAVPLDDLAWLVESLAKVEVVRAEYHRSCDPAPFTSERALIERIDAAMAQEVPS
ncbi:hypothetical protein [Ornithinimicrobium murale]|uniref:hypothetical protein n=1 Tax=Ornithinimicrobium murale TaxID=1050153 RepID=UPI000E0D9F3D|nr:hypothetical protein [Ornithinimicrobium murale]